MTEAARFLGVHHYTLRFLVDSGYVETTSFEETGRKAIRADFITAAAARQFQDAFVPAQELARRLGTHVRVLVPRLSEAGPPCDLPRCGTVLLSLFRSATEAFECVLTTGIVIRRGLRMYLWHNDFKGSAPLWRPGQNVVMT